MHHQFNDTDVLLEFYGRRFTGSTHRHNTVHAAFHLQLHELLRAVSSSLPGKRRDQCGINSTKHRARTLTGQATESKPIQISTVPVNTKSAGPVRCTAEKTPPS